MPFTPTAGGVRLAVRLTPRASGNRIDGVVAEADGGRCLKVAVTAVPEDGKANAALIALLAKCWKIPKSAFTITAGTTDRRKTLSIDAAPERIGRHIADLTRSP